MKASFNGDNGVALASPIHSGYRFTAGSATVAARANYCHSSTYWPRPVNASVRLNTLGVPPHPTLPETRSPDEPEGGR
jgi:hypothetical protein